MGTALVPLGETIHAVGQRPTAIAPARADFLAQLIATAAQAPQTRARRRAEPSVATAAYGLVRQWPTPAGQAISRSL